MIIDKNYLHGQVVGIGKIRRDGSEEFRMLYNPVGNKIVSGGLDDLLMCEGNPNTVYNRNDTSSSQ